MAENENKKKISPKVRVIAQVVALLTAEKVSAEVIAKVNELATTSLREGPAEVTLKNAKGEVQFIFCSYHKKWEPVSTMVKVFDDEGNDTGKTESANLFGKAQTPSGFARSCKEGAKAMNTGARDLRKQKDEITQGWIAGEIPEDEAKKALQELEATTVEHKEREDGLGYTEDEAKKLVK